MKNIFTPTHTDKVYWPGPGYTKSDLIDYFDTVSAYMLPQLQDRPVVMKRFPEGIEHQSFFQKNVVDERRPDFVKLVTIPAKTIEKDVHYIVCNNKETLSYMANLGAIELHPWNSRIKKLDKPDLMIFDLDPGEETVFEQVIEAAHAIKKVLDICGIDSYVKTSGKRGLHVYVPLSAKYSYDLVREFALRVAEIVVVENPLLASLEKHPAKRKDKIFVDYLRNAFGQTAVAAYCTRATPTATVSTPLEWGEVRKGLDPKQFTIKTMRARLKKKGDLWQSFFEKGTDLHEASKKLPK